MDEEESDVVAEGEGESTAEEAEETRKTSKSESGSKRKSRSDSRTESRSRKSRDDSRDDSLSSRNQQLFLVEFLVDTVAIDPCAVDDEVFEGQTCLSLSFLNFPPMEICEKDFNQNRESGADKIKFNCGKSLMFAFGEKQCERPPPLSVEITVSKILDDDTKVEIGAIKICISELFHQIMDIVKFKPDKLPTSKSIKDCFMLIGPGKRTMGEVSVYIRLSCLGQNVITEFQCGPDLKTSPVVFKSKEGQKAFEFTGTEGPLEGQTTLTQQRTPQTSQKGNCGCIPQSASQGQSPRGGQGDASLAYSKGSRLVLDLPEKRNRCKEEGGGGGGGGGREKSGQLRDLNVASEFKLKDGVTVSKVPANPNQNCFVLKVGDKGQIPDRGKMILEFRTPKQKILPKILPPYHEDIAVQTDPIKKGKGKKKK